MRFAWVIGLLIGPGATAAPIFEDFSADLPEHIYAGGWEHFTGGGVAVLDCNADGLPDIFAAGGETPAKLILNEGIFSFSEGVIPRLTGVTGAYPIDMDADGILDLFVLRVGPNVALKGGPDCRFEDATDLWGLPQDDRWSTAFTAWWEQGEERPTLAIGNYVDRSDKDGPFEACDDNQVLRPRGQAYVSEPLTPGFCPLSMLAARDARGRMSLRISNDRHYYVAGGTEQMWDITDRRFLTADDGWDPLALWGMGLAARDLTGDGRDEVMITAMGDHMLQIAQADGSYVAAPFEVGTAARRPHTGEDARPSTGWHAEFGDIDNDGMADLFIAKGNVDQMPGMATRDPNTLLMQHSDGGFHEVAAAAGIASLERARGAALADFDGDGRLDILVLNRRAPMEIYRNITEETGAWVSVSLRQPGGNTDAIGAQITLSTEFGSQVLQQVIGAGHAGGQLLPRHFGLGMAEQAILTVEWPDGSRSEGRLAPNRSYIVSKP